MSQPPKIASLLPSSTEIACALGLGEQLVARSHECDYPPQAVAGLPMVTKPRLDPGASSGEIHRQVQAVLGQALSVYEVDAETLRAQAPDLILTQTLCEVCAVSLDDVRAALASWEHPPELVALAPNTLAEVWTDIRRVGRAAGVPERAAEVIAGLEARVEAIRSAVLGRPRPSVALLEWIDPPMAGGNWMPELVELAGGDNALGRAGAHAQTFSLDDFARADPDWIVVLPCGFDLPRTRAEIRVLKDEPTWRELRAVKEGRVVLTDGNQYFNRPGPRLVESLEILAEVLHPETFSFGHQGSGWEPLG